MALLLLLFILVIAAGVIESRIHKKNLKKIPWIIHVNGIRGKSSTTRLIHGGLAAAGYKVIAKTTGTEPRLIFEDGQEKKIFRAGIPRIIEQRKVINSIKDRNIDILVLECMAISPEMQWISENKLLQADIGVITNVRYDHQDKMGRSLDEIASTLALTIPKNGVLITGSRQFLEKFRELAATQGTITYFASGTLAATNQADSPPAEKPTGPIQAKVTDAVQAENDKINRGRAADSLKLKNYFKAPVFRQNVASALEVCRLFDLNDQVALKGMATARPDPGALGFYKLLSNGYRLYFINGFAANDYESTLKTWEVWQDWYNYENYSLLPLIGIFNSRIDRGYRLKEISKINASIKFSKLFITGYSPFHLLGQASLTKLGCERLKLKDIEGELAQLTAKHASDLLIFGFGNTKGQGLELIEYFRNKGEEL